MARVQKFVESRVYFRMNFMVKLSRTGNIHFPENSDGHPYLRMLLLLFSAGNSEHSFFCGFLVAVAVTDCVVDVMVSVLQKQNAK